MPNIFNLVEEYYQLQKEIESLEGEVTEELAEKLKINEQEVEGKIKAYYSVIKFKEAEQEVYKKEIERFTQAIKTRENLIKRLKNNVSEAVEIFGSILPKAKQKSLVFDTLKVSNKETDSVIIDDNFSEISSKEEKYKNYYNYRMDITLTPDQNEKFIELLSTSEELTSIFISSIIVPKKDIIKDFYLNRPIERKTNPETNQLEEVLADSIPGASIQHNLTPIFK